MQWLQASADYPMENLERERVGYPKDINISEKFDMEEWSKIPPSMLSNLITNYRKWLIAGMLARYICTKY